MENAQSNSKVFNTSCKAGVLIAQSLGGRYLALVSTLFLIAILINSPIGDEVGLLNEILFSPQTISALILIAPLRYLWFYFLNKNTKFELLPDRIIASDRFLNDEHFSLPFTDVNEVSQSANIYQKIFGVGNLQISIKGSKNLLRLNNIEKIDDAFMLISEYVADLRSKIKVV